MIKRKIIKYIYYRMKRKNLNKEEKKLMINSKDWVALTDNEKKKAVKCNLNIAKIMKNIYYNWDNVNQEYFISDLFYQINILPKLNSINYDVYNSIFTKSYFTDKNYEELIANQFKFSNCVIRHIDNDFYDENFNYITPDEALKIVSKYDKLVFKNSLSDGHGKGVSLIEKKKFNKVLNSYDKNYVVQELIHQHKFLANFNNSSVNVIRITSLLWKGKVYILSGVLRIGAPGAFCDHRGSDGTGPRIIGLEDDGTLIPYAVDPDNVIKYDNVFGKKISGKIPFYDKIKKLVCEQHKNFIHHKIIGWDITINDNDEIICIEYNSNTPGIIQSQMVCGPIFSKKLDNGKLLLDDILKDYGDY